MAISLDGLDLEFRARVEEVIDACARAGVEMRPYTGVRTPRKQAKLWRQSRATEEIAARVAELRNANAPFLADTIEAVGPQHGRHVTNALPGLGWHQWGEAVDCFWSLGNGAEWSTTKRVDGINGYQYYAEQAQRLGLTPGGYWKSLQDWPHVQKRVYDSPRSAGLTLAQIDAIMQERFG